MLSIRGVPNVMTAEWKEIIEAPCGSDREAAQILQRRTQDAHEEKKIRFGNVQVV